MRWSVCFAIGVALVAPPARGSDRPPWAGWTSTEVCQPPARTQVAGSAALWLFAGVGVLGGEGTASDGSGRVWGVTGRLSSFDIFNASFVSGEFGFDLDAGGGSGGARAQLGGRLLFGWRGYVTQRHGPFVRMGAGGVATGQFFYDYFGLPLAVAGYEYIDHGIAFDAGAMAAVGLTGGFGLYANRSRDLGGTPMVGGYSLLLARPAYLRVEWQRVFPPAGGGAGGASAARAIDDVRALGCVRAPMTTVPLFACADTGIAQGRVEAASSTALVPATAFTAGLSLGFGVLGAARSGSLPP